MAKAHQDFEFMDKKWVAVDDVVKVLEKQQSMPLSVYNMFKELTKPDENDS